MSSSSTPTPEHDAQLLSIGQQCSAPSCHLVDFLPFRCQHCTHAFCGDHFLPATHSCDKYDETKHNRIAPSCPLCHTPVAIPPGEDPNIRMERHINTQCLVMTGRSGQDTSTPRCANGKCKKLLFSPIRCDTCKQQFCPQHRFPKDHICGASAQASKPTTSSKPLSNISSQVSAASAAAKAALSASARPTQPSKQNAVPTSRPSAPPVSATTSSSGRSNPFSKTDRSALPPSLVTTINGSTIMNATNNDNTNNDTNPPQRCSPKPINKLPNPFSRAKAEKESRLKAMQERAKKGLLSEEEKAMLASLQAEKGKKDDCIIV